MFTELLRTCRSLLRPSQPKFEFSAAANRFADRLRQDWAFRPEPVTLFPQKIGVVVSPWLFTPTPFFMIEAALQLRMAGHPVTVIWDQADTFIDAAKPREVATIKPLLDLLPHWLPVIYLHEVGIGKTEDFGFVDRLVYENSVRHLRGESNAKAFTSQNPRWKSAMQLHASRIASFISSQQTDRVFIPGGVWANSGIWSGVCGELNHPYTTCDSGVGQVFISRNSAAAHFGDLRPSLEAILSSGENLDGPVALALEALQTRMEGRDLFALQQAPRRTDLDSFDLVVPLNLRCDSAALCRQRVFSNVTEWLCALLDRVTSSGDFKVAIRQHPSERLDTFRGTDVWREILSRYLQLNGSVQYFPGEADINTYDLIQGAKVVLPFTSRIGIEAAMMGKPVITSADCHYNECGFTVAATDEESYFRSIMEALSGRHLPSAEAQRKAAVAYYIMEYCMALPCCLTPQPPDYAKWIDISSGELGGDNQVNTLLTAVAGLAPLPLLMHVRNATVNKT